MICLLSCPSSHLFYSHLRLATTRQRSLSSDAFLSADTVTLYKHHKCKNTKFILVRPQNETIKSKSFPISTCTEMQPWKLAEQGSTDFSWKEKNGFPELVSPQALPRGKGPSWSCPWLWVTSNQDLVHTQLARLPGEQVQKWVSDLSQKSTEIF